jgi:ectoine hydroxylase-related dioxygenase (phytanoyl-CoA dioxygenase family)
MNTQQQVSDFQEHGFIVIKNFFSKEEIVRLREEVKKVFALQIDRVLNMTVDLTDEPAFEQAMYRFFETDLETFMNCGKQVQHLISLHRIGTEERITGVLKSLGLSFPIISVRPSMLFNTRHLAKKEEYWKLGAHQDWRSSQGSLDSVTVWFPLINAGAALGALQVVPGTHKIGLLDSEAVSYYGKIVDDFSDEEYIQLEFEQGDILFFSSFLVHRAGVNSTENIRWSVQLRYNNIEEETYIERGFPNPFVYKPQAELVTPGFPEKEQLVNLFRAR